MLVILVCWCTGVLVYGVWCMVYNYYAENGTVKVIGYNT